MIKEEIIELNNKEYTVTLNRQSVLKIEQYTNLQKSLVEIRKDVIDHIEEIKENENPFAEEIDIDEMQKKAEEKLNILHRIIERAFWIWLYPKHKLNINEVKEIIAPYYEDDSKMEYISELYNDLLNKSYTISNKYYEEQKNLKALASK
nr:MAG TPA: hypothetical protein [Caudoviricetes sp.]